MSYPGLPPLEDPEGHQWVRPASPPCPHCDCCSAELCQKAVDGHMLCAHYVSRGPGVADVSQCRCSANTADEDEAVLASNRPLLTECHRAACHRLVNLGTEFCCTPCRVAADGGHPAVDHSSGCADRVAARHGHADVPGMRYLLVRADHGHLVGLLGQLSAEERPDVDVRAGAADGTLVVAARAWVKTDLSALLGSGSVEVLGLIGGDVLDERQPRR